MEKRTYSTERLAWLAFGAVCFFWGTTYVGIRVGVSSFPPLFFSLSRLFIAGSIFLILFSFQHSLREVKLKLVLQHALAGGLLFSLGNGVVSVAEVHISSSLAAIISSLIPVWIVLMNLVVNRTEIPTLRIIAGTLMGVAGIIVIFGGQIGFQQEAVQLGGLQMFIAGFGWAAGSLLVKKLHDHIPTTGAAAFQMLGGGMILLPFSLMTEDWSSIQPEPQGWIALAYLIVFGSLISYVCFLYAMRHLPVTVVSMYAYINPIVALILGWMLLSEPLSVKIMVGAIITLSGVLLVNSSFTNKQ